MIQTPIHVRHVQAARFIICTHVKHVQMVVKVVNSILHLRMLNARYVWMVTFMTQVHNNADFNAIQILFIMKLFNNANNVYLVIY